MTIKKKFKEVTIRVEKLSRLNNAQIQNIIKFNENIILNHFQVDNFKNEIVELNEKVKRYQNLKNQHRNKKNDLIEKIIIFRVDKNALKKKIQRLQARLKIFFKLIDSNYINDFDFENERFKRTKVSKVNVQKQLYSRQNVRSVKERKSTINFSRNERETKTHKHHDLDQNYVDHRHDEVYDSRHYEREKRFKYLKLSSFDENRIE